MSTRVEEIELLSFSDTKTLSIHVLLILLGLFLLSFEILTVFAYSDPVKIANLLNQSLDLIIAMIPLHIFLHFIYARINGVATELVLRKIWLSISFETGYTMRRNSFIIEAISPFLISSIIFSVLFLIQPTIGVVTILLNYLYCSGDLVTAIRVFSQPTDTLVSNMGMSFNLYIKQNEGMVR